MQQQMFPCPNCGAPVASGKNFCANCGANLSQFTQRMPPPSPPPPQYGYRPPFQRQQPPPPYNDRQAGWGQQQPWNQQGPLNQPPGWGGDPGQYQQQYMYNNPNAPSPPRGSSSSTIFLIILIVLLVGVGGVIFAINNTSLFTSDGSATTPVSTQSQTTTPVASTTPAQTTPTPTTTTPQITAVTADALMAAYNSNASSAAATYEEKTIDITGTVLTFSTESGYIIFGGSGIGAAKIKCSFSTNPVSGVADGQTVTVQGTVSSYDGDEQVLLVMNCKLK
ncbi:MAG TPA: hypothetical protein DCX22_01420 [Dehalococcoidia bacterium]|nr:hypothetical protein [Dehalococcoidia bacterium]